MLRILSTVLLFALAGALTAQTYFQQDVDYQINVTLDDANHTLAGDIAIDYHNNAPEALTEIWMHLWPNAYSNPKTALAKQLFRNGDMLMFYQLEKVKGGIDSLSFTVEGTAANWSFHPEHVDVAVIKLSQPLQPGASIRIATPFRVKIPSGRLSRLGHIGQSYQITQWYPKPAVYDRNGWHAMPYLTQGEFYSEFGSFDVSITLPKNYVIGATGDLDPNDPELAFLDSLDKATRAEIGNYTKARPNPDFPPSSSEMKTVRFKQSNVHDFAWFADKRWMVLIDSVTLENGHTVTTRSMFTPANAHLWARGPEYLNDGVAHYSRHVGNYPYNHCTAVDGTISAGGGMEYPNITVIGNSGTALSLETVIVHEVGHNWFYGILGSNERENAWLDEGFNSYHETRYFVEKYGDSLRFGSGILPDNISELIGASKYSYATTDEIAALLSDRLQKAQPMQCHSDDFTSINYGTIVYKKTAAALRYLENYLGQELFDKAMKNYYAEWSFKHPAPDDVRRSFEASTGKDLAWFFGDLAQTTKRIDYAIRAPKMNDAAPSVKLRNKGEFAAPVVVSGLRNDSVVFSVWTDGIAPGNSQRIALPSDASVDKLVIDPDRAMLEYDRNDNTVRTSGILRTVEPLQFKFFTRIEQPEYTQIFWAPVVAWNAQNHAMLGLHLHNTPFPMRSWEFALTPMYSIATGTFTGFGRSSWYKRSTEVHLKTRSFRYSDIDQGALFTSDYLRSDLTLRQHFNREFNSGLKSVLEVGVGHLLISPIEAANDALAAVSTQQVFMPRASYTIERSTPLFKHRWDLHLRNFVNTDEESMALGEFTYNGSYRYNEDKKSLHWRVYGGYTATSPESNFTTYPLSGFGLAGSTDIFADGLFLSRGGNGWADPLAQRPLEQRQVTGDQGGLYIPTLANQWLASASLEYELPIPVPLSVYGGAMVFDNFAGQTDYDYSAGISSHIVRNVFSWHLPLVTRTLLEGEYKPLMLFTYTLHLDRIDPKKLIRSIG